MLEMDDWGLSSTGGDLAGMTGASVSPHFDTWIPQEISWYRCISPSVSIYIYTHILFNMDIQAKTMDIQWIYHDIRYYGKKRAKTPSQRHHTRHQGPPPPRKKRKRCARRIAMAYPTNGGVFTNKNVGFDIEKSLFNMGKNGVLTIKNKDLIWFNHEQWEINHPEWWFNHQEWWFNQHGDGHNGIYSQWYGIFWCVWKWAIPIAW